MSVLDLHAIFDAQHSFLDFAQHLAIGILKVECIAHAHRLAINLEDLLTTIVFDPKIVADGD